MGEEERLDMGTRQHETTERPGRDHVGDGRLTEDDRDLAEELASTEAGTLGAVDDDGRLAIEDDVEP